MTTAERPGPAGTVSEWERSRVEGGGRAPSGAEIADSLGLREAATLAGLAAGAAGSEVRAEQRAAITRVLDKVNNLARWIFHLHGIHGLLPSEIANVLRLRDTRAIRDPGAFVRAIISGVEGLLEEHSSAPVHRQPWMPRSASRSAAGRSAIAIGWPTRLLVLEFLAHAPGSAVDRADEVLSQLGFEVDGVPDALAALTDQGLVRGQGSRQVTYRVTESGARALKYGRRAAAAELAEVRNALAPAIRMRQLPATSSISDDVIVLAAVAAGLIDTAGSARVRAAIGRLIAEHLVGHDPHGKPMIIGEGPDVLRTQQRLVDDLARAPEMIAAGVRAATGTPSRSSRWLGGAGTVLTTALGTISAFGLAADHAHAAASSAPPTAGAVTTALAPTFASVGPWLPMAVGAAVVIANLAWMAITAIARGWSNRGPPHPAAQSPAVAALLAAWDEAARRLVQEFPLSSVDLRALQPGRTDLDDLPPVVFLSSERAAWSDLEGWIEEPGYLRTPEGVVVITAATARGRVVALQRAVLGPLAGFTDTELSIIATLTPDVHLGDPAAPRIMLAASSAALIDQLAATRPDRLHDFISRTAHRDRVARITAALSDRPDWKVAALNHERAMRRYAGDALRRIRPLSGAFRDAVAGAALSPAPGVPGENTAHPVAEVGTAQAERMLREEPALLMALLPSGVMLVMPDRRINGQRARHYVLGAGGDVLLAGELAGIGHTLAGGEVANLSSGVYMTANTPERNNALTPLLLAALTHYRLHPGRTVGGGEQIRQRPPAATSPEPAHGREESHARPTVAALANRMAGVGNAPAELTLRQGAQIVTGVRVGARLVVAPANLLDPDGPGIRVRLPTGNAWRPAGPRILVGSDAGKPAWTVLSLAAGDAELMDRAGVSIAAIADSGFRAGSVDGSRHRGDMGRGAYAAAGGMRSLLATVGDQTVFSAPPSALPAVLRLADESSPYRLFDDLKTEWLRAGGDHRRSEELVIHAVDVGDGVAHLRVKDATSGVAREVALSARSPAVVRLRTVLRFTNTVERDFTAVRVGPDHVLAYTLAPSEGDGVFLELPGTAGPPSEAQLIASVPAGRSVAEDARWYGKEVTAWLVFRVDAESLDEAGVPIAPIAPPGAHLVEPAIGSHLTGIAPARWHISAAGVVGLHHMGSTLRAIFVPVPAEISRAIGSAHLGAPRDDQPGARSRRESSRSGPAVAVLGGGLSAAIAGAALAAPGSAHAAAAGANGSSGLAVLSDPTGVVLVAGIAVAAVWFAARLIRSVHQARAPPRTTVAVLMTALAITVDVQADLGALTEIHRQFEAMRQAFEAEVNGSGTALLLAGLPVHALWPGIRRASGAARAAVVAVGVAIAGRWARRAATDPVLRTVRGREPGARPAVLGQRDRPDVKTMRALQLGIPVLEVAWGSVLPIEVDTPAGVVNGTATVIGNDGRPLRGRGVRRGPLARAMLAAGLVVAAELGSAGLAGLAAPDLAGAAGPGSVTALATAATVHLAVAAILGAFAGWAIRAAKRAWSDRSGVRDAADTHGTTSPGHGAPGPGHTRHSGLGGAGAGVGLPLVGDLTSLLLGAAIAGMAVARFGPKLIRALQRAREPPLTRLAVVSGLAVVGTLVLTASALASPVGGAATSSAGPEAHVVALMTGLVLASLGLAARRATSKPSLAPWGLFGVGLIASGVALHAGLPGAALLVAAPPAAFVLAGAVHSLSQRMRFGSAGELVLSLAIGESGDPESRAASARRNTDPETVVHSASDAHAADRGDGQHAAQHPAGHDTAGPAGGLAAAERRLLDAGAVLAAAVHTLMGLRTPTGGYSAVTDEQVTAAEEVATARQELIAAYTDLQAARVAAGAESYPGWEHVWAFSTDEQLAEVIDKLAGDPSGWVLGFDVDETLTSHESLLADVKVLPEVLVAFRLLRALGFTLMVNSGRTADVLRETFGEQVWVIGLFGGQYWEPGHAEPVTHPAFNDWRGHITEFINQHYYNQSAPGSSDISWEDGKPIQEHWDRLQVLHVYDPGHDKNAFTWDRSSNREQAGTEMERFITAAQAAGIQVQRGANVIDLLPDDSQLPPDTSGAPTPAGFPWDGPGGWEFRKSVGFRFLQQQGLTRLAWFGDSGSDARARDNAIGMFGEVASGAAAHQGTPAEFLHTATLRFNGPPELGRFLLSLATGPTATETTPAAAQPIDLPRPAHPHVIVLFGATGNRARYMVLPAIVRLAQAGLLPRHYRFIAIALDRLSTTEFHHWVRAAAASHGIHIDQDHWTNQLGPALTYIPADATMTDLAAAINTAQTDLGEATQTLHYLAVPPHTVPDLVTALGQAGLLTDNARIALEKPFGTDLHSAIELNTTLHRYVTESQVLRIDHYLSRETVQNLIALRFDPLLESIWHGGRISHLEIDIPETMLVGARGPTYDNVGALRDMFVTHLLQVLGIIGMEPPATLQPHDLAAAQLRFYQTLQPLHPHQAIYGQYHGYRNEPGVAANSTTETFIAARLHSTADRWAGTTFLLRTGKALAGAHRQVTLTLRPSTTQPFTPPTPGTHQLRLDLTTGRVTYGLLTKQPGPGHTLTPTRLQLHPDPTTTAHPGLPAYDTLFYNALTLTPTLFTTAEIIETLWQLITPTLTNPPPLHIYPQGSWGPDTTTLTHPHTWALPAHTTHPHLLPPPPPTSTPQTDGIDDQHAHQHPTLDELAANTALHTTLATAAGRGPGPGPGAGSCCALNLRASPRAPPDGRPAPARTLKTHPSADPGSARGPPASALETTHRGRHTWRAVTDAELPPLTPSGDAVNVQTEPAANRPADAAVYGSTVGSDGAAGGAGGHYPRGIGEEQDRAQLRHGHGQTRSLVSLLDAGLVPASVVDDLPPEFRQMIYLDLEGLDAAQQAALVRYAITLHARYAETSAGREELKRLTNPSTAPLDVVLRVTPWLPEHGVRGVYKTEAGLVGAPGTVVLLVQDPINATADERDWAVATRAHEGYHHFDLEVNGQLRELNGVQVEADVLVELRGANILGEGGTVCPCLGFDRRGVRLTPKQIEDQFDALGVYRNLPDRRRAPNGSSAGSHAQRALQHSGDAREAAEERMARAVAPIRDVAEAAQRAGWRGPPQGSCLPCSAGVHHLLAGDLLAGDLLAGDRAQADSARGSTLPLGAIAPPASAAGSAFPVATNSGLVHVPIGSAAILAVAAAIVLHRMAAAAGLGTVGVLATATSAGDKTLRRAAQPDDGRRLPLGYKIHRGTRVMAALGAAVGAFASAAPSNASAAGPGTSAVGADAVPSLLAAGAIVGVVTIVGLAASRWIMRNRDPPVADDRVRARWALSTGVALAAASLTLIAVPHWSVSILAGVAGFGLIHLLLSHSAAHQRAAATSPPPSTNRSEAPPNQGQPIAAGGVRDSAGEPAASSRALAIRGLLWLLWIDAVRREVMLSMLARQALLDELLSYIARETAYILDQVADLLDTQGRDTAQLGELADQLDIPQDRIARAYGYPEWVIRPEFWLPSPEALLAGFIAVVRQSDGSLVQLATDGSVPTADTPVLLIVDSGVAESVSPADLLKLATTWAVPDDPFLGRKALLERMIEAVRSGALFKVGTDTDPMWTYRIAVGPRLQYGYVDGLPATHIEFTVDVERPVLLTIRAVGDGGGGPARFSGEDYVGDGQRARVEALRGRVRRLATLTAVTAVIAALATGLIPLDRDEPPRAPTPPTVVAPPKPAITQPAPKQPGRKHRLPVPANNGRTLNSQTGDHLTLLGAGLGADRGAGAMVAANPQRFGHGEDPDFIVRETFRIPRGWDGYWRPQPGDTLAKIGRRFGLTVAELRILNPGRFTGTEPHRLLDVNQPPIRILVDRDQRRPAGPAPGQPAPGQPAHPSPPAPPQPPAPQPPAPQPPAPQPPAPQPPAPQPPAPQPPAPQPPAPQPPAPQPPAPQPLAPQPPPSGQPGPSAEPTGGRPWGLIAAVGGVLVALLAAVLLRAKLGGRGWVDRRLPKLHPPRPTRSHAWVGPLGSAAVAAGVVALTGVPDLPLALGAAVAAGVLGIRRRVVANRRAAAGEAERHWAGVAWGSAAGALDAGLGWFRLVAGVSLLGHRPGARGAGFTVQDIAAGLPANRHRSTIWPGWLRGQAAHLAGADSAAAREWLEQLVRVRLLVADTNDGVTSYRPHDALARAPPKYVAALLADPAALLNETEFPKLPLDQQAAAILAGIRDAIWAHGHPSRTDGQRAALQQAVHTVRAAAKHAAAHNDRDQLRIVRLHAELDLAALGVSARRANAALDRAELGLRRFQGQLVGAYLSVGNSWGLLAAYETFQIAEVTSTPILLMMIGSWSVGLAGLMFNSVYGSRLGMAWALGSGLFSSVLFTFWGWTTGDTAAVLFALSGTFIWGAGLFQGWLTRHPLPPTQDDQRATRVQTWNATTSAALPLIVATTVALVGLQAANTVLGMAFAALTLAVGAALRGGEQPAAARQSWGQPIRDIRVGLARAVSSPGALARFIFGAPALSFGIGIAFALALSPLQRIVGAQLADLTDVQQLLFAAALVTSMYRAASAVSNAFFPRLVHRFGLSVQWLPRTTSLVMLAVAAPTAALQLWPTSFVAIVILYTMVGIAFQLPQKPMYALAYSGPAKTRGILAAFAGGIVGLAYARWLQTKLLGGSETIPAHLLSTVELAYFGSYVALALAVVIPTAHLVSKLKIGPLALLNDQLRRINYAAAAAIMNQLPRVGVNALGDLVALTREELERDIDSEHVTLIEQALDKLDPPLALRQEPARWGGGGPGGSGVTRRAGVTLAAGFTGGMTAVLDWASGRPQPAAVGALAAGIGLVGVATSLRRARSPPPGTTADAAGVVDGGRHGWQRMWRLLAVIGALTAAGGSGLPTTSAPRRPTAERPPIVTTNQPAFNDVLAFESRPADRFGATTAQPRTVGAQGVPTEAGRWPPSERSPPGAVGVRLLIAGRAIASSDDDRPNRLDHRSRPLPARAALRQPVGGVEPTMRAQRADPRARLRAAPSRAPPRPRPTQTVDRHPELASAVTTGVAVAQALPERVGDSPAEFPAVGDSPRGPRNPPSSIDSLSGAAPAGPGAPDHAAPEGRGRGPPNRAAVRARYHHRQGARQ